MKKRILALLLCVVLLVSVLPLAAFAAQAPTESEVTVELRIPISKTVKVADGSAEPGSATFEFQVSGLTNARILEYEMGNMTISTNGADTYTGELSFTIKGAESDILAVFSDPAFEGFYVAELDGGEPGWTYDDSFWTVKPLEYQDQSGNLKTTMVCYSGIEAVSLPSLSLPTTSFNSRFAFTPQPITFTNTYNAPQSSVTARVPIPFTKVVAVDGIGNAPKQRFQFAITNFACNAAQDMIVSIDGGVLETNGVGTYEGCLYLNLEMSSIQALGNLEEGFVLYEVPDGAKNWTYDQTAWYVVPHFEIPENGSSLHMSYSFYALASMNSSVHWTNQAGEEAAVFTNTYTVQEPVTFEFPYTKTVLQAGTQPSGSQSFTLELSDFGAPVKDITVTGTTIETAGPGIYHGTIKITVPQDLVDNFAEGFLVTEQNTGLEGWTYSDAAWYCCLEQAEGQTGQTVLVPELYDVTGGEKPWETEPQETMQFVNTFTKELETVETPEEPENPDGQDSADTFSGKDPVLHYESNGGTAYPDETYAPNTTVPMDKSPFREGYTFTGWYLDAGLTVKVTSVLMDGDKTVYAGWSRTPVPKYLNGDDHFAYVIGYEDGTTRPLNNITRAEVAMIFYRLLKLEYRIQYETDVNSFTDVQVGDWYCTAVSTLASMGILNGRTATSFAPNANITRAEFAAICARCDESVAAGVACFTDLDGHWAKAEVEKAAFLGWIRGYADGSFQPDQYITRAEAFTLINRVLQRIPGSVADLLPEMAHWPDNADDNVWYYIAVQEATCSHEYEVKADGHERWVQLVDNVF